jgi:hypothetical protein
MLLTSSTIIQVVQAKCWTGSATIAFFYFDPKDTAKQDIRGFLTALLIQLSDQADDFFEVMSSFYSAHGDGSRQPSDHALIQCLMNMMSLSRQSPVYIIVDGLECCPGSHQYPSPREQVLTLMEELVRSRFPHLHLFVTSRLEIDIWRILEPLATNYVSLHNELGQRKDIAHYVQSVVDSDTVMQRWPEAYRELIIDTLIKDGSGMYVIIIIIHHSIFSW